jgi:hypothetical protein
LSTLVVSSPIQSMIFRRDLLPNRNPIVIQRLSKYAKMEPEERQQDRAVRSDFSTKVTCPGAKIPLK